MKYSELIKGSKALSSSVRKINRNLIFRHLYDNPGLSKQELCKALDLSLPTLTQNLTELMERGLVSNEEIKESTGGRKARSLNVCSDAFFSIGLDVTAHHLSGVVIDLVGDVIISRRISIPFVADDSYFCQISEFIEKLLYDVNLDRSRLLGVGLAVPAIISEDGQQLTYATILNFTHGKLSDFSKYIPYPCRFINDADAGGIAEYWNNTDMHGVGRGKDIVYLMISNSVGGAFFTGGDRYTGCNMRASEFGHITLHPDGKPCYCGQLGCTDVYLNTKQLSDPYDGNLPAFFDALDRQEEDACALWNSYKRDLSLLINSLRMVYDCDIVLGGYLGSCIGDHIQEVRQLLSERNHFDLDGAYLIPCLYRREAAAVGAALTYVDDFLMSV